MTPTIPNAKPSDGAMRELTVEELEIQTRAAQDVARRVRRAMARAVDHESYANIGQVDRVVTAVEYALEQVETEYTDREEARRAVRATDDEIPF